MEELSRSCHLVRAEVMEEGLLFPARGQRTDMSTSETARVRKEELGESAAPLPHI
jgi:hypothetical protein